MPEPEKKKLTVEDLVASQEETQRILKAVLWEIQSAKKPENDSFAISNLVCFGFGLFVLFCCLVASAQRGWKDFDDSNAIGATANRLEEIQGSLPVYMWAIFGFMLLCTSFLMRAK